MTDPRRLRPGELCLLLNSTPLGAVIDEGRLRRQRLQAGLRVGDRRHVDLIRYVAWLIQLRHAVKPNPVDQTLAPLNLIEAAQGAAAMGSDWQQYKGHGQKLTSKQETVIAALLTEPTYAAAAAAAGIGQSTLYRWLRLPAFRAAYYQARRELVDVAIGRIQAGAGQSVETLLHVATRAKRDADRVRAAVAILNYARRGLADADLLHPQPAAADPKPLGTAEVVRALSVQLQQLEQSELPTPEKTRLTVALTDALLRAIGIDLHDQRLEALQTVLLGRTEKGTP